MSHPMVVTMICDGNRPDFVTDATTPVMASLKRAGTWFSSQRGIFPSATRASSASIATGCFPGSHGLRGNAVGLPIEGGYAFHDVGRPEFFETYRRHFGRMLTRPALAERVSQLKGAIISATVSPGAAFFHDSYGHAHMYHRELCYGPGRLPTGEVMDAQPGIEGDKVATRRFIEALLEKRPSTSTLWLSEPDKSMHAAPLGGALHLAALKAVDARVAEVSEAVDRLRDQGHDVLFLIGSDHGHESITEIIPVEQRLFEAGFKTTLDGPEILVAPQGSAAFIYFGGPTSGRRNEAADWLGEQDWVERVFMGEDLSELGQIPADDIIAIDMAKTDGSNINGVPGLSATAHRFIRHDLVDKFHCGVHGGRGRYETNPVLMAIGRGFHSGTIVTESTSITDFAPTALHHLGAPLGDVDGRPLQTGLAVVEKSSNSQTAA